MPNEKKPSYIRRVSAFYFAPIWQSFFTIIYLVFFFYFAVFHSGKIVLAVKFIGYTLANSTSLLGLAYLFWGVVFLISLIIPFSLSLYAILFFYEMWNSHWDRHRKLLMTILLLTFIPLIIIIMDEIIRIVASQSVLAEFVRLNELNISGR